MIGMGLADDILDGSGNNVCMKMVRDDFWMMDGEKMRQSCSESYYDRKD